MQAVNNLRRVFDISLMHGITKCCRNLRNQWKLFFREGFFETLSLPISAQIARSLRTAKSSYSLLMFLYSQQTLETICDKKVGQCWHNVKSIFVEKQHFLKRLKTLMMGLTKSAQELIADNSLYHSHPATRLLCPKIGLLVDLCRRFRTGFTPNKCHRNCHKPFASDDDHSRFNPFH